MRSKVERQAEVEVALGWGAGTGGGRTDHKPGAEHSPTSRSTGPPPPPPPPKKPRRAPPRRKTALEGAAMPAKLVDCRTTGVSRSELFLVEGDSALGSARM